VEGDAKPPARHRASAAARRIALQKHFVRNAWAMSVLFRGSFRECANVFASL